MSGRLHAMLPCPCLSFPSKLPCPIPLAAFLFSPILPTLYECRGAHVVVVDRAQMRVMCRKEVGALPFPSRALCTPGVLYFTTRG
jgi:hypothetical protein